MPTLAVKRIRELFQTSDKPLTLTEIRSALPDLKSPQISSSLCYFVRRQMATKTAVANELPRQRKQVWQYTFIKEETNANTAKTASTN